MNTQSIKTGTYDHVNAWHKGCIYISMKLKNFKTLTLITVAILVISGIKNSLEMSSSSFLDSQSVSTKSITELTDEMKLASNKNSYTFKKSSPAQKPLKIKKSVNSSAKIRRVEQKEIERVAYIQEDLSLDLIEYYNPNKFSTILKPGDGTSAVNGVLEVANGVIEKIDVTLPSGESLFVEYGEMKENRFTYSLDGQPLRGIIYKIDAVTYMVSLDEGDHAGTRMKFKDNRDLDREYDAKVDANIVEASIAAQKNGFVF